MVQYTTTMNNLNETKVNFSTSSLADLMVYFSKYDLTACLTNCSSRGICANAINRQNQIYCLCQAGYKGVSCNIIKDPCQSVSCLNNGICRTNSSMTYCSCSSGFYGEYCENKIDLCSNQTCSSNGVCVEVNGNRTYCKCFLDFSGDICQIESASLKTIKTIRLSTVIVAIVVLVLFSALILFLDFSNLFVCCKTRRIKKIKRSNIFKYVYKP